MQQVQSYKFFNLAIFHIDSDEKAAKTLPNEYFGAIREVINVYEN